MHKETGIARYFQIPPSKLLERCGSPALQTNVHREFLYGIQNIEEFQPKGLNDLTIAFEILGEELFAKYPLACCALPRDLATDPSRIKYGVDYILTIMDGHHRRRVGDSYHVQNYPVDIYSVEQASRFFQHENSHQTMQNLIGWIMNAECTNPQSHAFYYRL